MHKNTQTRRLAWTAPRLAKIGTIADVAGPVPGSSQTPNDAGVNTRS